MISSRTTLLQRLLVGAALLGAITTACSLVVSNDADQCTKDADCAAFAGAVCRSGVCVNGSAAATACVPKTPTSQLDILNEPCTSSTCIPFDDCARIGLCADAALPALVAPGDGGVK